MLNSEEKEVGNMKLRGVFVEASVFCAIMCWVMTVGSGRENGFLFFNV